MTIKTTDTAVLTRAINILDEPASFLLDVFFPGIQTEPDSEEIHFDTEVERPRLAPFVHPTQAGIVVEDEGYTTQSFKPAYIKDKRYLRPGEVLKRTIGEPLTGAMSSAERHGRLIAQKLLRQRRALTRREEVMASEALRLGQVTVQGERYPTVVVNFGRDAALSITLAGAAAWDQTTSTPLDDLEDWADLIHQKSGAGATFVVMDPTAWKNFRNHADVKNILDLRRASASTAEIGPNVRGQGNAKARFKGTFGDVDIWVYQERYTDDAGAAQLVMPANTVIVGAPGGAGGEGGVEGVRAYGPILDPKANFRAERLFAKSWEEEDPALTWLMAQSAPLVVPYRPNATLRATVV